MLPWERPSLWVTAWGCVQLPSCLRSASRKCCTEQVRVCVCQEPTAALIANPLLPFNPANPKLQTVCRLFSSGLKKAGSYPEGSLKICWKKEISEQLILTLCSMTFVYNCHGWRGPAHAVTGHHLVYGKKKKVKPYHWNRNSHKLSHLPLTLLYFKTCMLELWSLKQAEGTWGCGPK